MRFNWAFGCEGKDGAGGIGDITILTSPPDMSMHVGDGSIRFASIVPKRVCSKVCDVSRGNILRRHLMPMDRMPQELRPRILSAFTQHAGLVRQVVAERRAQNARFKSIKSDADAFACIASVTAQACCITFDALSVHQYAQVRAQREESK